MKVTLMLADYAQVSDGKLTVVGGGWNMTPPQPVPFAIAGSIDVPWHETNQNHTMRFELVDIDGHAVNVDTPNGEEPLFFEGTFQVGRPPGVRPGTPIPFHFAFNSGPLPLPPGGHYVWQLTIDGEQHQDWRLAFSTQPDAQSRAA